MSSLDRGLILAAALSLAMLSAGCTSEDIFGCDTTPLAQAKSPDGTLVAEAVLVQCGATTSDAIWLMLGTEDAKLDEDLDRVAVFEGDSISLRWEGSKLIVAHKGAKAFRTDGEAKGVHIEYLSNQ